MSNTRYQGQVCYNRIEQLLQRFQDAKRLCMFKEQKQISTHTCVFRYFKQTLCTPKFLGTVLNYHISQHCKLKCETMCNGRPAPFHLAEGKCNPDLRSLSFLTNPSQIKKQVFCQLKMVVSTLIPKIAKLITFKRFQWKNFKFRQDAVMLFFFHFLLFLWISTDLQETLFLDTLCIFVGVHSYVYSWLCVSLYPILSHYSSVPLPLTKYKTSNYLSIFTFVYLAKNTQRFGNQLSEVRFCFVLSPSAALGMGFRASYILHKNSTADP